jgi:hypothetical protein
MVRVRIECLRRPLTGLWLVKSVVKASSLELAYTVTGTWLITCKRPLW